MDEELMKRLETLGVRRGRIESTEPVGNYQVIRGYVPLAKMFGYATDLRSLTQGRGNYVMQFDHYEKAPPDVLEELFKSRGYGYVC